MGRRRRSEVLTQALLASAPDAVVVVDDDGSVVEFNPAAERMFGVRRETVIGSALDGGMLLPSSPSERVPLDGSYEATATRSDGATFPAEVSTAPVVGVDARLQVLYVRDISERRRAERAVYDLAAIIESSEDAIISRTLDGVIESWNAGAERLYGHTAAEAIGRRISLVEPLGRADQSPAVLALLRRGRPIENLETVRRVVAEVGTVVDAGYDHVRLEGEQTRHGKMHAIGRRAFDEVHVRLRLTDAQRQLERERIAGATAIAIRRNHGEVAQALERFAQRDDAARTVAVVVGY